MEVDETAIVLHEDKKYYPDAEEVAVASAAGQCLLFFSRAPLIPRQGLPINSHSFIPGLSRGYGDGDWG